MTPLQYKIMMAKEALNDMPVQIALDEEYGAYVALDAVTKSLRTMIFEVERLAGMTLGAPLPPPTGAPLTHAAAAVQPRRGLKKLKI